MEPDTETETDPEPEIETGTGEITRPDKSTKLEQASFPLNIAAKTNLIQMWIGAFVNCQRIKE